MNVTVLMGRLVRDPETRNTPSGVAVTNFTLAVDRRFKNANGEKQSDFIPVVAWKNTAEFVNQYFHKGSKIIVEGSTQSRNWTDQDGKKRTSIEVNAERVYFAESARGGGGSYGGEEETTAAATTSGGNEFAHQVQADDTTLPFDL
jgi:single-strand DNA-binding protein